ncbi:hypothetical protein MTO96_034781 [Rhipicephalus appendiculatus]
MSAYLLSAIFTNFSVDKSGRMNLWSPASFSPYRPGVLKTIEKAVSLLEDQVGAWSSSLQVIDLVVAPDMLEMAVSGAGFVGLRQGSFDTFDIWERGNWVVTVVQRILRRFFLSYATPR